MNHERSTVEAKDIPSERRPHLRIAVTPECNFKCAYCRPGGEGYSGNPTGILPVSDLMNIISLCGDVGFRDAKITGGEPLMRKDLEEIIRGVKQLGKFDTLDLVTNGSLLVGRSASLKDAGLDNLTVSLDAADKARFFAITRSNSFPRVVRGIREAVDCGIKTRINSVLCSSNKDQLQGLVRIAEETGADLKIIDVMDLDNEGDSWGGDVWKQEYLSLDYVQDELRDRTISTAVSYPPGGLGTPMKNLILDNGVRVMLRDATVGTNYDSLTCGECKYYPCQDALISLRITHDGLLKKCLIRNDNLVDVATPLRQGDIEGARSRIQAVFDIFMRAEYKANAWKPNESK